MGKKDMSSPEGRLNRLLLDLCHEQGFCSRLSAEQLLQAHPILTDELFAKAVIEAEGMTPDHEKAHLKSIRERFIERFGAAISAE